MVHCIRPKVALFASVVGNALVRTNGDGSAKSLPHVGSRVRWEHGVALAAAVSPLAAKNHSGEFGVHGDAICYFSRFFHLFLSTLLLVSSFSFFVWPSFRLRRSGHPIASKKSRGYS